MTASVASFLTQAQKKGAELPPALSGALLLAAVRLSAEKHQGVRPYQLLVDDDGTLELLRGDTPATDGYAAPEFRNGAVLSDDARVLVFAAGALGYELITLTTPRPGEEGAGPEVRGPLAPVIRKAMAERQHRYKTLKDMARAIESIGGRPTLEEERLILAAVAASTQLPPAQKLAKMELQKLAATDAVPSPPAAPAKEAKAAPSFTQVWDPLEPQAPPATAPEPPAPAPEPAPAPKAAEPPPAPPPPRPERKALGPAVAAVEAEERARELAQAFESRGRELAEVRARVMMLEEQVRSSSSPPPLATPVSLATEVQQLLDRRNFAEAERALQHPSVNNDPALQLLLGQTLSSIGGADAAKLDAAAAAFRRASELDPKWARPHALLGGILLRQGKRSDARTTFRSALQLDPACPEALAAMASLRPRGPLMALSAGAAALALAAVLLAFRHSPSHNAQTPPAQAPGPQAQSPESQAPSPPPLSPAPPGPQAASPGPTPVPEPQTQKPEVTLRLPEPGPGPEPERKTRKPPKPRKSQNRAAAEQESARGEKALRSFDTTSARAAFASALQLDPSLPSAHRGMGMVYVLLGKNAEAKAEYTRYLQLAPDAPDREQISRVLSR